VLHASVALCVYLLARTLFAAGQWGQPADPDRLAGLSLVVAATLTALLFGIHPLRVEVVAWVSAMPYALATLIALVSTWAWLRDAERGARVSWLALALFAISLLARPLALGLPLVFAALDRWRYARPARLALLRALPFAALALAATAAEFVARAPAAASEVPWSYRLQSALTAPFVYAWRTLVPVSLTPLDVLPLEPVANPAAMVAALAALVLLTAMAWSWRRAHPAALVAWLSYLALLAPAVGLVPSGLQATADRYTYLPGIMLVLAVVGALGGWAADRVFAGRALAAIGVVVALGSGVAAREVLGHWRDSVTLWTRVVAVDPGNDIGHYNLAVALAAAGQADAAAEHYRAVLGINPAHGDARRELDRLDASRLERQANDLAARGQLEDAVARYQSALDHDPHRSHAQAALGMALASLGRGREAAPHLKEAIRLGETDSAVFNTLAGLLIEAGAVAEAKAVLEGGMTAHPDDVTITHNLARLLVSLPGLPEAERLRAYRMAEAVVIATDNQDARALDTLAAALASIGRIEDARRVNAQAARVAAEQGDRELSVQITARGQSYR
jgi:tetratricopeptide (TPR) repeat protein